MSKETFLERQRRITREDQERRGYVPPTPKVKRVRALKLAKYDRVADRIDGYDRDDLGLSQDY